jgi:hypothetical protein
LFLCSLSHLISAGPSTGSLTTCVKNGRESAVYTQDFTRFGVTGGVSEKIFSFTSCVATFTISGLSMRLLCFVEL